MIKIGYKKMVKIAIATGIIVITGFFITGNQELLEIGLFILIGEEVYILFKEIKARKNKKEVK